MSPQAPLAASQIIVQVCLFLVAAIALFGGAMQMYLGHPGTSPRLDNVHRFMAGVYLSTGIICLWAALTVREQGMLIYLLALGVLLAGCGRLLSIKRVGLQETRCRVAWLSRSRAFDSVRDGRGPVCRPLSLNCTSVIA